MLCCTAVLNALVGAVHGPNWNAAGYCNSKSQIRLMATFRLNIWCYFVLSAQNMSKRPLFAKADFESFVKATSGKDAMSRAGGELSMVLKCH